MESMFREKKKDERTKYSQHAPRTGRQDLSAGCGSSERARYQTLAMVNRLAKNKPLVSGL
jgi:hypothetical protein